MKAVNSFVTILNGYPSKYFHDMAATIARAFNSSIALISIVKSEEVEFRGNFGMEETSTVDRGMSLCSLAILDDNPTVFEDATKEPCLLTNPLVAGNFGLRFYAGAPLKTRDGYNIGTVCIVDKEPRPFSEQEISLLNRFAENVMEELEERKLLTYSG